MKAMILAAGRGERLRPLTDTTPKPLIQVGGQCLIEYHLHALKQAGIADVVINLAWLGDQIESLLGDGSHYGVNIVYSYETGQALETGGGIFKALDLLADETFIVTNADIWTDYDYQNLPLKIDGLAHLVMVDNPQQHPKGDFSLEKGLLHDTDTQRKTFSGVGVYSANLFKDIKQTIFPLAPLLREAMQKDQVTGEYYQGKWFDIGTVERLELLDASLKSDING